MPESAQEWYDRVSARIAEDGYGPPEWRSAPSFPLDESGAVRALERPGEEPLRGGLTVEDCPICERSQADDAHEYIYWRDDLFMLGVPFQPFALPLVTYLMPRRHADLAALTAQEARRQGELLVALERAAVDVLNVPRVQVARNGEGLEHLHWGVFARPTGAGQLRGSFLVQWSSVLPSGDPVAQRADLDLVAARLMELTGGLALSGG
ncbi:hypothetical protein [Nocardioides bigeumensis]|uniref:HIT domain-containing protein n=1 Tax=Nocardioides bigeumensis TaxID=433657 RepID=A0ABP5JZC0_9ACTN